MTGWHFYFTYRCIYGIIIDKSTIRKSRFNRTPEANFYIKELLNNDNYTLKYLFSYLDDDANNIISKYIYENMIFLPFVNQTGIATFKDLNVSFVNQIYPIGCALTNNIYYDGEYTNSVGVFNHDVDHANEFLGKFIETYGGENNFVNSVSILNNYLTLRKEKYFEVINKCKDIECQWLEYIFFMLNHET